MNGTCGDCGTNIAPCTGKRGCRHAGRWEDYMVEGHVWDQALTEAEAEQEHLSLLLCIGCLEARLGRALTPADFTGAPINDVFPWDTPRLAARKAGRAA